jgi:hypothetical protein
MEPLIPSSLRQLGTLAAFVLLGAVILVNAIAVCCLGRIKAKPPGASGALNAVQRLTQLPALVILVCLNALPWICWFPLVGLFELPQGVPLFASLLSGVVPLLALLMMLFTDIINLCRGIAPDRRRPTAAIGLALAALCVFTMFTGALPDALFGLTSSFVSGSGFFAVWLPLLPVLLIGGALFGLLFWLLSSRCLRGGRSERTRRAVERIIEPEGVSPIVDLVTARVSSQWLGRAIFLYPIAIVTAFSLGGSALVDTVRALPRRGVVWEVREG